jgi:hypothetical protein
VYHVPCGYGLKIRVALGPSLFKSEDVVTVLSRMESWAI